MKHSRLGWLALLAVSALGGRGAAGADYYLKDGDRVVFYGDSITDQRLYTTFVESYTVTRFPAWKVSFVHSGWGGDRVTGGGGGPIDRRLQRDVVAYRPTVVTIMLGMNDASYRPFDEPIFATYRKGYEHIIESLKQNLPDVRITVIQPSPFDDVTRPPMFEGGYNAVLVRYGEFVKELAAKEKLTVADLNAPVVADLQKAFQTDPTAARQIIGDRVHPGPGGHLLMAAALLKAWGAPAVVSGVEIDARDAKATRTENAKVSKLEGQESLSWTQEDAALPWPFDRNDAATALVLRVSDLSDTLNRQTLKVNGAPAARYALKIDGKEVGAFTREQLESGINLSLLSTPMAEQSQRVLRLIVKHNNLHFARWRQIQTEVGDASSHLDEALKGLDAVEEDLTAAVRRAAQPEPHRFELTPTPAP